MFNNPVFTTLPKSYIDTAKTVSIAEAIKTGALSVIRATVMATMQNKALTIHVQDSTGGLKVVFYSYNNYHLFTFRKGYTVTLSGRVRNGEMSHPKVIKDVSDALSPIYSNPKIKRLSIKKAIERIQNGDVVPLEVRLKRGIPDLKETATMLHFPKDPTEVEIARWSMAYRELYTELLKTQDKHKIEKEPFNVDEKQVHDFIKSFPFQLTEEQKTSVYDIVHDLKSNYPMRRILIGDVGCGKTEVAICAIKAALTAGYRVLYLCPTEILTFQTYYRLAKSLKGHAYVSLHTSKEKVSKANPDVYVGTHALLFNNWQHHKIGLIIADEQHKFGVAQRETLVASPECNLLEMSATPIPRTYALFMQSLMSVSIINELPFKKDTETELVIQKSQHAQVINTIGQEVDNGRQALVVYPSVESEKNGLKPAKKAFEFWQKRYGISADLLYGDIEDKETVLRKFSRGDTKVLVSTSAAEVGLDVPGLTVCVVANAERFGLVQLHQIRGRVGRRGDKSYFFMICKNDSSVQRLQGLVDYSDGFDIAEIDAQNRGTGHISGEMQSGHFFRFFSIKDLEIVNFVKEDLGIG